MNSRTASIVAAFVALAFCASASFSQEEKTGKGKTQEAKKIFVDKKCISCHSIESVGIKKKPDQAPPDLSNVGSKHSAAWIMKYLKKKVKIEGEKHPKKFKGSAKDFEMLASWLETLRVDTSRVDTSKVRKQQ